MNKALATVALIAFGALSASGQSLGIKRPQESIGNPTSKPEPRRSIKTDPISLYQHLLSDAVKDRREALHLLGHEEINPGDPVESRLYAVNLDSDADPEYTLIATGHPFRTIAIVFDRNGQNWWVVGDFTYWWHWDANEAERFIELREIVSDTRKEILVRDAGGGTGVSEQWLSIYRMQNGNLYRIFRTMEDGFHFVYGLGTSEYEHRTIEYPDHAWNVPAVLVVRYRKRTEPAQKGQAVRIMRDCSVFRWDAAAFIFTRNQSDALKLCSSQVQ